MNCQHIILVIIQQELMHISQKQLTKHDFSSKEKIKIAQKQLKAKIESMKKVKTQVHPPEKQVLKEDVPIQEPIFVYLDENEPPQSKHQFDANKSFESDTPLDSDESDDEEVKEVYDKVIEYESFLDKIFLQLESKKGSKYVKEISIGSVYPGFKTIPIQQLKPKRHYVGKPLNGAQKIWRKDDESNKIHYYNESCPLSYYSQNGFFDCFYDAYYNHGDVKIKPDDVWIVILLYFSKYVDDNAVQLRHAFVTHEGRRKLRVETFVNQHQYPVFQNDFFTQMLGKMRQNVVGDVLEHLQCNFSSSDQFGTLMAIAAIMNTFKKYFQYEIGGVCGIVNMHMGGTLEDWQMLEKKLAYLRQFDVDGQLKLYIDRLQPVLGQFTQTYKGNVHLQFWNNIYHERQLPYRNKYPTPPTAVVNGWLIRFFTTATCVTEQQQMSVEKINVAILYANSITGKNIDFKLEGGCMGVSVEDLKVYRPHFSYAITQPAKCTKKEKKNEKPPFKV